MSKPTILCVDDEIMILKILEIELESLFDDRYLYEFAENPNEALEILDDLTAERLEKVVVLADWLMPGMKGDEFLMCIHAKYPQIVKVLLSGQVSEEAVTRAKESANLHRCLSKPWTREELIDTIESAVTLL